jgi:exodeoxyribonuclease VII large subunit
MKTYLSVPIEQKDRVKNLGAWWDPARKCWYVPDGTDLTPFLRWVADLPKLSCGVKRVLHQRVR